MWFAKFGNAKKTEICYDYFSVFKENVFGLQIFVDYASRMEIAHALNKYNKLNLNNRLFKLMIYLWNLLGYDHCFVHAELVFP